MAEHARRHPRHARDGFEEDDALEPLFLRHVRAVPGHAIEDGPHDLDTPEGNSGERERESE